MLGGIVVTTGRLGDICKVGGNRLVGSSTVGSTVGSTVDGSLGSLGSLDGSLGSLDGLGSKVVRVGFGRPSWL